MIRRWLAVSLITWLQAIAPWAAETGVIGTLEKGNFAGEIRFLDGSVSVRSSSGGQALKIGLEEVKFLRLQRLDYPAVSLQGDEQSGVRVSSYAKPDFSGTGIPRTDAGLQFQGSTVSWKSNGKDPIAIRWDGLFVPLVNGVHRFHIQATGNARLWINSHCVGSILATNELRESSGELALAADRRYPLLIELAQTIGPGEVKLLWSAAGIPLSALPSNRLIYSPKTNALTGISKGLLGTYFGNPDFSNPRTYRVDPRLNINWVYRAPFAELGVGSRFSVVWTGTLEVPKTDAYRFEFAVEGGIRCTLDSEIFHIRWDDNFESRASSATFPMQIDAGRPHPIKIEFFNEVDRASVVARFYPEEPGRTAVFADGLRPAMPPDFSIPIPKTSSETTVVQPATATGLPAGVLLNNGSFVAQRVESGSATQLQLKAGDIASKLPADLVSRIYLSEISPTQSDSFDAMRVGAYLHNGDFVEGEFQGMDTNSVKLGSILFGNQKLDRERVQALVLRSHIPQAAVWQIKPRTGSILRASRIEFAENGIRVSMTGSRDLEIPLASVSEMVRSGVEPSTQK